MPWARFDDHMPTHRKVRPLTDPAFRLWVSAVCWCAANGTDGVVLRHELAFVSDVKRPARAVPQLVANRLWEEIDNGWLVHDFLVYNPSSAQVEVQRKLKTERQRRWRSGQNEGDVDASTDTSTDASRDATPTRPDPSPLKSSTSSAAPSDGQTDGPPKPKHKTGEPLEPDAFARFWKIYPRKVAKGAAIRAWNTAIRARTDPKTIVEGLEFYVLECKGKDATYIKHPATWLNGQCWADEPDPVYVPPVIGATSEAGAMQPKSYQQVMAELEAGLDP